MCVLAASSVCRSCAGCGVDNAVIQPCDCVLGETPLCDRVLGETPLCDRVLGETPLGDCVLGETPLGDCVLGETPLCDCVLGETPLGDSVQNLFGTRNGSKCYFKKQLWCSCK